MVLPRRVLAHSVVFIVLTFVVGCQEPTTTRYAVSASESPDAPGGEEEVFGEIWENGARSTSTSHYASLSPFDAATLSRLHNHQPDDNTMWADPDAGTATHGAHMFGWFDPRDGGGCGGLTAYLSDDLTARDDELHPPGPGLTPEGKERHCVRPGLYSFRVGNKEFRLDYLQLAADVSGSPLVITNTTAGTSERLEAQLYTQPGAPVFDAVVNVDLTPGSWGETRVLDAENALNDLTSATFTNQPNPSGSELDWFRFSVAGSSSGWNLGAAHGRFLGRLYWDYGVNNNVATGYFDARGGGFGVSVIRHHRFVDHVSTSRTAVVALEAMRPDELPNDLVVSHLATRQVQITRGTPWPCDTLEGATTWQATDQFFNASCSTRGANIQYRWHFGNGFTWTPWSADTLYEFMGHTATGGQQVLLEVKNTSTGLTARHDRVVTVNAGQVTLTGPTVITSKQTNWYYSNIAAYWFERWLPDLHWYLASSTPRDSLGRIWYVGDYTVDLRHQASTANLLRRGRLQVQVCISHPENCEPNIQASARPATSAVTSEWALFGGGPWISWGSASQRRALRFYDLLGMHDGPNRFARSSWLDSARGTEVAGGSRLDWQSQPLDLPHARAFQFAVPSAPDESAYAFGLALDPDLGADAADDQTGFDAARGLAYVFDRDRAIGYMLRTSAGTNALASVQQFGIRRWAPAVAWDAWSVQHTRGVALLPGPSDVQLVLSTPPQREAAVWVFVIIRASSLAELQARADEALARLAP